MQYPGPRKILPAFLESQHWSLWKVSSNKTGLEPGNPRMRTPRCEEFGNWVYTYSINIFVLTRSNSMWCSYYLPGTYLVRATCLVGKGVSEVSVSTCHTPRMSPQEMLGPLTDFEAVDLEGLALRVQMKHVGGFRPAETGQVSACRLLPSACHTAAAQGWGPWDLRAKCHWLKRIPGFCLVLLKISANLNWQYFVHFYF